MVHSRVVGKRILLVEDERWVRECIKRLLWLDGHIITDAADGAEAFELFGAGQFDVVITDCDMPRMAGDEFVTRIRNCAPLQPIVMITAGSDRLQGRTNPVNAILGKPFGVDELRQILVRVLPDSVTEVA